MRKKAVAGNWKMNMTLHESVKLAESVLRGLNIARSGDTQVIISPPFTSLYRVKEIIANKAQLSLGAQNCHQEEAGAYTGEVSASMLRSLGAEYVILGHSERRQYFGETDELINQKVTRALEAGLRPIFCCGESLEERKAGNHFKVVETQMRKGILSLEAEDFSKCMVAYEPVWAIGTGQTAGPVEAQEVHGYIRRIIEDRYNSETAQATTVLYGGSCKPSNAASLFAMEDIDGGLIGGASLKAEDFLEIVYAINAD